MNSFKRTMTAVGTAVVITAVGVLAAPAATAAPAGAAPGASSPSAVPAEQRAALEAAPGTKDAVSLVAEASIYQRANNEFIVHVGHRFETTPVRVEVRRAGSDKVVAVVDKLTWYYEQGADSQEWGTAWYQGDDQPLVFDDMADYELDVYAKDRAGTEVVRRNAGRSTYALDARFEAKFTQQEFSLDDLDTEVTGSVTAVHPRTGKRLPLAGANVRVRLGNGRTDVVSDAQGKFATSVAAEGTEGTLSFFVSLAGGDTALPAQAPANIRAQQATLKLSTTAPLTARYGTAVTLHGTLTRRADDGTVKPAAGRKVRASGVGSAYASTGADGGYTLAPPVYKTGSLNVAPNDSWLAGDGTRTATVAKVTHTTQVVEEKLVANDKYGRLTISGKVLVDGYTTQQAPIQIQLRTSRGEWVLRQSFVVPYNKTFTVTVLPSPTEPSTQWRIHTPGTTNIGPSTGTRVIRPTRAETWLRDERFGPAAVAKGQQLYVSAVLKTNDSAGVTGPYAGQKVRYYFRPDGSTVWQEMGTSVSLANGAVGKKFTAETSGTWRIRFVDPDATHLVANGDEGRIVVTG